MSGTNIAKPFSLRLPKTEKGMRNLRRIKLTLQWVVLLAFALIGFSAVEFFSPLSITDGVVIFSAFLINFVFYVLIGKIGDLSLLTRYSLESYVELCKKYPALLAYHQALEREPVEAELDAFYKHKQSATRFDAITHDADLPLIQRCHTKSRVDGFMVHIDNVFS